MSLLRRTTFWYLSTRRKTFWYLVQTETECVPDEHARTHPGAHRLQNFENPTFASGCLYMLIKQKSLSFPRNLGLGTFGELLIVFSTKGNLLYILSSTTRKCCLLHLIKENCLLKTSENSNLDDSGISLPEGKTFPSRTNLKLHNVSVILKMVKKVITNLDSSKASDPDCIPVVALKNCEPKFS